MVFHSPFFFEDFFIEKWYVIYSFNIWACVFRVAFFCSQILTIFLGDKYYMLYIGIERVAVAGDLELEIVLQ